MLARTDPPRNRLADESAEVLGQPAPSLPGPPTPLPPPSEPEQPPAPRCAGTRYRRLSQEQVRDIRELLDSGELVAEVARAYDRAWQVVNRIKTGQAYRGVA